VFSKSLSIALAVVLTLLVLNGCASVQHDVPRAPSHAITDGDHTTVGRVFAAQAARHPGLSGFQILAAGRAAFVARAALADSAERTLDLQYYSVGEDLTTDLLLLRIVAAAERGVRVRLLLDDIHAPTRLFARRAIAAYPGIQVRLFNPFRGTSNVARLAELVFDGERLNRRMHNKLWVTDNAAAVAGSRNLGDEYFDANESANFSDVDLLAAGPIVKELSRAFDTYWNSTAAVPVEAFAEAPDAAEGVLVREGLRTRAADCHSLPPCQWLAEDGLLNDLRSGNVPLSWARAQLNYDRPDQDKVGVTSGIEHGSIDDNPGGSRTRAELLIASPYFIPSENGRRHLGEMRKRGVRVAVLTNSLASTDSPAAHAGYARHRAALLQHGVELYEVRPGSGVRHRLLHRWWRASPSSLHAKIIVQDRERAIVGSLNQDPRSRLHNTEAWITLESTELAADLASLFEEGTDLRHAFKVEQHKAGDAQALAWKTEEDGKTVRHDAEPMSSVWLRLWRGVLGALIPEHQL
jgi:cardiolipin synthase C